MKLKNLILVIFREILCKIGLHAWSEYTIGTYCVICNKRKKVREKDSK